jgi:hypothetical protein|tara:strand:- start:108 stop:461 length:354 start_codon:yes stop_codon:yes gene_type:complete
MKYLAAIFLCFPSCATIMTGHTDYIELNSNPTGATYKTNGGLVGVTPGGITVNEKEDVVVMFSKEGYQETAIQIPSRTSKWVWGNLLIGGVIGLIIDFASDGIDTHDDSGFVNLPEK